MSWLTRCRESLTSFAVSVMVSPPSMSWRRAILLAARASRASCSASFSCVDVLLRIFWIESGILGVINALPAAILIVICLLPGVATAVRGGGFH